MSVMKFVKMGGLNFCFAKLGRHMVSMLRTEN